MYVCIPTIQSRGLLDGDVMGEKNFLFPLYFILVYIFSTVQQYYAMFSNPIHPIAIFTPATFPCPAASVCHISS